MLELKSIDRRVTRGVGGVDLKGDGREVRACPKMTKVSDRRMGWEEPGGCGGASAGWWAKRGREETDPLRIINYRMDPFNGPRYDPYIELYLLPILL